MLLRRGRGRVVLATPGRCFTLVVVEEDAIALVDELRRDDRLPTRSSSNSFAALQIGTCPLDAGLCLQELAFDVEGRVIDMLVAEDVPPADGVGDDTRVARCAAK